MWPGFEFGFLFMSWLGKCCDKTNMTFMLYCKYNKNNFLYYFYVPNIRMDTNTEWMEFFVRLQYFL